MIVRVPQEVNDKTCSHNFKPVSYDDARQRIKMLDEEMAQHQAQIDSTKETLERLEYMMDACSRMRRIFIEDLENAGETIYKEVQTDGTERPVSDLYPVQSGDE